MPDAPPPLALSIAFATRSVPMSGRTPWERSLGGSESAMVFVARALAARGHTVDVYTMCDAPGEYDGVVYMDIAQLDADAKVRDWDVFVSLRFPDLVMKDIRASLRILWCQDVLPASMPVAGWASWVDQLVFVSEWHRVETIRRWPDIASISSVVPNSVDLDLVASSVVNERDPNLLVHLSRPERGLRALLEAWPSIRARAPEARLLVARYRSFNEPAGSQIEAFCLRTDEAVRTTPGASHVGNLSKPELYALLSRAALMVYPAEFDETSCIAAIEAQACGTPVVAVRRGALPETLAANACVLVDPRPDMPREFADRVVELLFNPLRRAALGGAGRIHAAALDSARVAERWEELFVSLVGARAARSRTAIQRTLVERGDADAVSEDPPTDSPGPAAWREGIWRTVIDRLRPGTVSWLGDERGAAELEARLGRSVQRLVIKSGDPEVRWTNLVDAAELLRAPDRADFLAKVRGLAENVIHVLPTGPRSAVSGQRVCPTYADIVDWFGPSAEVAWTAEAALEWGTPEGCWVVSHHDGAATARQDAPPRKLTWTRPRPTVSACMIVRDAEDTLLTTLRSIECIADEIRVLDTGSRDGTREVVRHFMERTRCAVSLAEAPWPDDFAAARNLSVEGATGDWILWIDADERLIGGERLRRLLQTEVWEAYAIRQHNHIFDRSTTQVEIPFRVYRNGRGYRFFGAVHEHPEKELNIPISPWTLAEGVDILHYGYLTEPTRVRKLTQRNLALLSLDFEKYPGRLLSDILYLRDCVNLGWFDQRDKGAVSAEHRFALRVAIQRFEDTHMEERGRFYHLGRQYYDRALGLLGEGAEIVVQVGGQDATRLVHRVRHAHDAVWLSSNAAAAHAQAVLGGVG